MTLFEKIITRQIPSEIVYETEEVIAFRDISPKAPIHILVVPKQVVPRIAEAETKEIPLLGKLLLASAEVARQQGLEKKGYRLVINNGPDGGETVPHLHVHLLGGRSMCWPPG